MTRKTPFERYGTFYIGRVENGTKAIRLLCFRHHESHVTGASKRFSRKEAFNRCMRSLSRKTVSPAV